MTGSEPSRTEVTFLGTDAVVPSCEGDTASFVINLVHCPRPKQAAALRAAQSLFPNTIWPSDGETLLLIT